jgi:2-alkyl-3-oxoalkanoate reductase
MNILVTGGTGFTGAALVLGLAAQGHSVRALDYQKGIRFDDLKKAGAQIVIGSITDLDTLHAASRNVDVVFHLAAAFRELNVPDSHYFAVNVQGTRNVMEAATAQKVQKVVYCSTQGVHGHIHNPPGDENSPIAPEDYYQETKYLGEEVVMAYAASGYPATILRPTAIYGPGDPARFLMIFKWANRGFFPMFGDGKTFYHPVYIDNLVDAFIRAMPIDRCNGEAFIIGDEHYYTISELVERTGRALERPVRIMNFPILPLVVAGHLCEKVCKPFGLSPPIFPRRVDWYRQVRAFRIDKARSLLGYVPAVGIDEGLRRTAHWYARENYLGRPARRNENSVEPEESIHVRHRRNHRHTF